MDCNKQNMFRQMESVSRINRNNPNGSNEVSNSGTPLLSEYESLRAARSGLSQTAPVEAMVATRTINDNCLFNSIEGDDSLFRARLELGRMDANNSDMALLLRLGALANTQREDQMHFNLDDSYSSRQDDVTSNEYNARLAQEYLQQQQRQQQQLTLDQNVLAQHIQQLQHQQRQQQVLGLDSIRQTYGMANIYNFSPTITGDSDSNSFLRNINLRQYPNQNRNDSLLAALLSNHNDSTVLSHPPTGSQVIPSTLPLFNPLNLPSNLFQNRSIQHLQQQQFGTAGSSSDPVVGHFNEGMVPQLHTSNLDDRHTDLTNSKIVAEEQAPLRALSAYNFFFRYERDRILNSTDDAVGSQLEFTQQMKDALLTSHWNRDRSVKRRHRKSHGKISFAELSRRISQRWKDLPEDQKTFFGEVSSQDWERYRKELEQRKLRKKLSKGRNS
jgi:HMG (high mobility group) box